MVLLIDNYDSFSYNLVQLIGELTDGNIKVVRNDEITIDEIRKMNPESIILSPGPGKPEDAGICEDVVRQLKDEYPILGVCLGHQSICEVFGAKVTYAKQLMHGKQSEMTILKEDPIFEGLGESFKGARYHSLSADRNTIPDELEVIAIDGKDGEVMAVKHKEYPIYGLQFHPESVLTPEGKKLVNNFLKLNN
ncbi:anthranilate synthase component II [Eubacterium ventriosum]|jgi:anthranilate synthase component 2|uniref:Aminodeoxychorismate/anthranilate synthase component II n=1 Tax=Eubacterium ventriosum TaxID=39496 RepID=A0A413SYX5_9FIRM|nr:aminodeoxychorismate/anthranilate synthase component II [Eubacterium ventriosum]MBD9054600.1 aminodeoxychorismate/anthranilate synthase component II [Eubacterium ventriosum]MBD9202071.1 aminodeoxychorismate/anthranilate synthase component II [Eubacterium ventriosum]RHA74982.1 aminodeoxychorismate/anthranilate synthase component II [Eubacterium ventriosum]RHD12288.1 aminodeoxychorismate/anthranilate synthase component II [Eubacterium ventriosum]